MIILETDRLILRRQLPTDLDDLWAIYSDPAVVRFIPDASRTREETGRELAWFEHGHPRRPELGLWAAIHKPTGRYIGRCGLIPWSIDGQDEVEVAFLFAQEFWGQGLATEVATALLRYGFEQLQLSKMICMIEPLNSASVRVAQKIGMVFEKEFVDEYGLSLIYAMPRPDTLPKAEST